jgi:para-nitrobenzyl esterase
MDPVVTIGQGQLRGAAKDEVLSFKGIPYAAAPFGDNRFAAPQPPQEWDGVRDALEYGPTSPMGPYPEPMEQLLPEPRIPGEECLNLNVWTPSIDGTLHPVLVWIHGGGLTNGSGAVSTYDGSRFARDGVVCVTINYRLGADGWLQIDGAPANRGLLDQIAALRWVRENIAAFGGDPAAVTIAGESAGAMSVTTLLATPAAEGLFQRAIAESGAGQHVISPETAGKVTAALAAHLDVDPTVEGFSSVPVDSLVTGLSAIASQIAAQPDPAKWGELTRNLLVVEPVVDGAILPAIPLDAIRQGASSGVDVLIGTNADEHALLFVPNGVADFFDETMLSGALMLLGADPAKVLAAYRAAKPGATMGELMVASLGDWFFRIPAVRVAEARYANGTETFCYEFCWPSPQYGGRLGACHALEVPFVFDNLDDPNTTPITGPEPPQSLADEMHGAWVSFVKTGAPGWAPYGSARTTHLFNAESTTVDDPAAELREVWDGVR